MLKNLTLGSSVLTIGDAAFQLNDLESVTIPDSSDTCRRECL